MAITINSVNGITQAGWTTAGRPASPSAGQVGFNTTLNAFEQYNGTGWATISSWTTANRPVTPVAGFSGYNTSLLAFEFYNGTTWVGFNTSIFAPVTVSYLVVAGGGGGASAGRRRSGRGLGRQRWERRRVEPRRH